MQRFSITTEFIALNKLLKAAGVAQTGGHAAMLITQGEVLVDGVVERRKRCKIYPGNQVACSGTTLVVQGGQQ
jgi:ribosome-associated protein